MFTTCTSLVEKKTPNIFLISTVCDDGSYVDPVTGECKQGKLMHCIKNPNIEHYSYLNIEHYVDLVRDRSFSICQGGYRTRFSAGKIPMPPP